MKRKLIFSAICSVVFFIVAFAMICPNMQGVKWVHYEDPLITAAPVDGMPITSGNLSQDEPLRLMVKPNWLFSLIPN